VVGARPQFIKAAPVSRAMLADESLVEVMVHTGQHFDYAMSDIFFEELGIPTPAYTLNIHGGEHGSMTGRMLIALEGVMLKEEPDAVLVNGDTNSTLAGALAAAKLFLRVGHVEAGLRSFLQMPEEINRIVADRLSQWLFCPTQTAINNLANEGITKGIYQIGDVMYDGVLMMREQAKAKSTILERLGLSPGGFQLATLHRAENTNTAEALSRSLAYLDRAAEELPVLLPVHPRTRDAASKADIKFGRIMIIEPVGYLDMIALLDACTRVLTDSGGLQKEAYFFRKPCVTMRDATEWVETVEAGWNRLWQGPDYGPRRDITAYGNGTASKQIVAALSAEI
jgi:UDP-GlcNAc3NAcA epimerase